MQRRTGVLIALLLLIAAGLLALWWWLRPAQPAQSHSEALYAASFSDAQGQQQAVSQWRGKLLLVNFWASWCPPCLEEMPELSALQQQYQNQGVVIVGISTDDAIKMQEYARANPVIYPLLAGDMAAMQLAEVLGNDKGILPYTVLLRPDGSVALRYFGRLDMRAVEQALIAQLGGSR